MLVGLSKMEFIMNRLRFIFTIILSRFLRVRGRAIRFAWIDVLVRGSRGLPFGPNLRGCWKLSRRELILIFQVRH
jgi:hypothetical protein